MEATYNTKAIILRRESYHEHDSRVFAYTKEFGKLDLVARGTQKLSSKLAGHIEPLNLCDIMVVKGKQYDYVGSCVSAEVFGGIKRNYDKATAASLVRGLVQTAVRERESDTRIFFMLDAFLRRLNDHHDDAWAVYKLLVLGFSFKLFAMLGYAPVLSHCALCEQELRGRQIFFQIARGGMVCGDCGASGLRLDAETSALLPALLGGTFADIVGLRVSERALAASGLVAAQFKDYHIA